MLRTYFFIPASKPRFIEKMDTIAADTFVFDFEDAIAESENEVAFENIKKVNGVEQYWVRPRLFNRNEEINDAQLKRLFNLGFKNYFLPKISTPEELQSIYNVFDYYDTTDIQWILLIESPLSLINIPHFFSESKFPIKGIALGAQDYAAKTNMRFTNEEISWARKVVLNAAYAYNVEAIDFASMNIGDIKEFENEVLTGFKMGYTAKIIVHPNQLQVVKNIEYYSKAEIERAVKISRQIDFSQLNDFSIVVVDGKLYEKAHLKRIERIIEYAKVKNLI